MSFDNSNVMESGPSTSTYTSTDQWSQPCRKFKLHEILLATEFFNESFVIGKGGFGKVYKGEVIVGTSRVAVAIKRLDSMSNQGVTEFWAEVEMLSKLRHSHLVSLIGYCNYEREMILVYEYMPNGTLEDHLHKLRTRLSWVDRLKICIGAARGLDYLHTGTGIKVGVIHRDVKCSNILLHESGAAKISDFGLSRIGPTNQSRTYVDTLVKGTFGYLDPNYFATGKLTRKSDVYAFGVVLFEVLCRKRPVDSSLEYGLAAWAQDSIQKGNLKNIVDFDIRGEISLKCLKGFARIAERCLEYHPKHRPTMTEILFSLESILTLQLQTPGKSIFTRMVGVFPFNSTSENPVAISDHEKKKEPMMEIHSSSVAVGGSSDSDDATTSSGEHVPQSGEIVTPNLKSLTFFELSSATGNFSPDTYTPSKVGLRSAVAVKRLHLESAQGLQERQAPRVNTFLGKAGSVGLEVLDTLRSSMSNFKLHSGFVSKPAFWWNKVSILAFEVANTIVMGSNLMQSLSDESIQILKKDILHSEGVQLLVSTDMKELLSIAAADKREELEIFAREVVRFGDLCIDPQWHHLDRLFDRLDLDPVKHKLLREDAEISMQVLANLAQHTSELYHEYNALDRFEMDYRRKLDEVESLNLPRKGESLATLHSDVKHQRKLVRNLKRKSLWSKCLEEVVEKLVDVVTFIHQAIVEAFEENAAMSTKNDKAASKKPERLGVAGLALHYANLITQLDNIVSHPTSFPSNMRDTLYNGLPASVKACLRYRLRALDSKEVVECERMIHTDLFQMTMPQIKAEMERTLCWLFPVATDTTKAHQSFRWVGDWANAGNEFGKKTAGSNNIIRLQTLYHADKQKMDRYILDLIILLHRLVSLARHRDNVPKYTPNRSPPTSSGLTLHPSGQLQQAKISPEDKNLLEEVTKRRMLVPGVSRSQSL